MLSETLAGLEALPVKTPAAEVLEPDAERSIPSDSSSGAAGRSREKKSEIRCRGGRAGGEGPDDEVSSPAPSGTTFGQYVLEEHIATGGMAQVYKARMLGLEGFQKTVAIKRILPHLTSNEEFVKMFVDEAKLAAQLAIRTSSTSTIWERSKVTFHRHGVHRRPGPALHPR